MPRPRLIGTLVAAVLATALLLPSSAGAASNLTTGFLDSILDGPDSEPWFDRADDAGAGIVRVNVPWRSITSNSEPADPRDPADPAYGFTNTDHAVREADERGMDVLLTAYLAPDFAEGSNRPADIQAGTWKPDPDAFADFGTALAERYSSKFPDPEGPGKLPRVRFFSAWNEPNLNIYIAPQFKGKTPLGADIYRDLLNAFYDAVKDVRANNKVIGPGTGGGGDPKGGNRMRPVLFLRELFCLRGKKKPRPKNNCKTKDLPKLDIVSHHPIGAFIPNGGPRRAAISPDDAFGPDLDRVTKVMRAAEKAGNVLPRKGRKKSKRRKLWVTELFWFSNPPVESSFAYKPGKHARFVEDSLYQVWKDGARVAIQLGIRDTEGTSLPKPFGSGLYFLDDTAKPALTAFRFPFVIDRKSPKKIKVWGKAPVSGTLKVQEKNGSSWRTIDRFKVKQGKVFYESVRLTGGAKLRGRVKGETSRPWNQKK